MTKFSRLFWINRAKESFELMDKMYTSDGKRAMYNVAMRYLKMARVVRENKLDKVSCKAPLSESENHD